MTPIATIHNASIQAGVTTSPAGAVPANANSANVRMSRENWPAVGVDIEVLLSYDNGITYAPTAAPTHIAPFVATPKQPTVTDAIIGVGWSSTLRPTHAKLRSTSPSAFTSTIIIEVG
jgi:hypothetical protein